MSEHIKLFVESKLPREKYLTPTSRDLYWQVEAEVRKEVIQQTLERVQYNQVKCAKILGINRNTLRKWMIEAGIGTQQV